MQKKIYLSIQTIPTQNQTLIEEITRSIQAPLYVTDLAKWFRENLKIEAEKKYRETALDGLCGEIFSIAWAIDDGGVIAFWRDAHASERGLLQNFIAELKEIEVLSSYQWILYDPPQTLKFLWQRCVINSAIPSSSVPLDPSIWSGTERVFDIKSFSGTHNLNDACKFTGISTHTRDDELTYYDFLSGHYDQIASTNRGKVEQCRQIYKKLNFIRGLHE